MGIILLSSLFHAIARPKIYAVLEDYIARLGKYGNDLISLKNSSTNTAYIACPIISEYLADQFGSLHTLGVNNRTFAVKDSLLFLLFQEK